MPLNPVFEFGEFRFDPAGPLLSRGSHALDLAPKALDVLTVLVKHAGRVVSKADLLEIVWPGIAVEEGNLAVHVHALRQALGTGREYIETAQRRGYRFAAPVRLAREGDPFRIAACYLQQQTAQGCRRAAAEFGACLEAEPRNAAAKTGLANAFLFRLVLGDMRACDAIPRVRVLLDEAARIDPASAGVHLSRARWLSLSGWHWQEAREQLQQALQFATDDDARCTAEMWLGCQEVERGRSAEGIERLRRVEAACPVSPFAARFLAESHYLARDYERCVAVSRKALHLHPHCWLLHRASGRAMTALREFGEARRAYRRAVRLCDGPRDSLRVEMAYLEGAAGNHHASRRILERLEPRVPRTSVAQVYAVLGNKEHALDLLEEACANREWALSGIGQDGRFDPLRATRRFRRVAAAVGV